MLKTETSVSSDNAKVIIAIIGTDMERFPTDSQLPSRAGLCLCNYESAKNENQKTRKGNKLLRSTLMVCAHAAAKVRTSKFFMLNTKESVRTEKRKEGRISCRCALNAYCDLPYGQRRSCF